MSSMPLGVCDCRNKDEKFYFMKERNLKTFFFFFFFEEKLLNILKMKINDHMHETSK